jgi:hypothetical protein
LVGAPGDAGVLGSGSPLAKEALERIAELFAIEADISGRPPAERLAARQVQSVPRLGDLE